MENFIFAKCSIFEIIPFMKMNSQLWQALTAFAARFLKCVLPFWDIMH